MAKDSTTGSSMEQVRDLLMGTQLHEIDQRFKRLEEKILREMDDIQDSIKKRLESLDNFMKSEAESMLRRIQDEQSERVESLRTEQRERTEIVNQVVKDLTSLSDATDRRHAALSSSLDTVERTLRELMLAENNRLSDKVDEKYQDALKVMASTAGQIRYDMSSRAVISNLLTEMAIKLSGQDYLAEGSPTPRELEPVAADESEIPAGKRGKNSGAAES